ncbi:MAG: tetratricopeptide repeat protein [Bryobacteraceae bacterium]|nr:tetratricopeptide repeat protein [Bryobacteraceae bacterium]MDW8379152.1 tetratricopeptide repeat protein [Bryobacterales bacterium]
MKTLLAFFAAALLLAQGSAVREQATRLFREQKFREAAAALEAWLREDPNDKQARYLLALSWQQAGDYAKAEAELLTLVQREPAWAQAQYALARLLFFRGRFEEALSWNARAEKLGEPRVRTRHLQARIEEERGNYLEALEAYRSAVAADRKHADSLSGEASVLFKLGRWAEAKSSAQSALRLDPSHTEAKRILEQVERAATLPPSPSQPAAGVRFERKSIPFRLEHFPTPDKQLVSTMAGGLAIFDYDQDGRLDLFFTNGAELPALRKTGPRFFNRLYRNLGDWQFEDVTEQAGLQGDGFSIGAAVGDFDRDGWLDLFVAGAGRNLLYHNRGGRFDLLRDSGIRDEKFSVAAAWLDYDFDGLLDLFVVNYLDWTPKIDRFCGDPSRGLRVYCHPSEFRGTSNKLYRNLGGGRFEDVSERAGIAQHTGKGMSVAVADYDADGRPDLFVTNDTLPNFLFRNTGQGFEEVALAAGVAFNDMGKPVSSMGAEFTDYDNDGRPDILFTALVGETFPLFRNLGGSFRDVTYPSRVGLFTVRRSGWGVALADLNNDGLKDIATANSHVTDNIEQFRSERYREPNLILLNEGGAFRFGGELGPPAANRGLAAADLDGDGLLDLVVTVLGEPAQIWRNTTPRAGNWISVQAPYGARVRAGRQWQQMYSSRGYASSVCCLLHFGIATAAETDLEVLSPNGQKQLFEKVTAGQTLILTPPSRPPSRP